MIIKQKYNSAFDIDIEFITPLENLLDNIIPSFNFIKNYEKSADEDNNFIYYLFFGAETNSPIGFAMIEIIRGREIKQNIFQRLIKKTRLEANKYEYSLKWSIPGKSNEGVVFSPRYNSHANREINKIVENLFERQDIIGQSITLSDAYNDDSFSKINKEIINNSLVKNCSNYQEYIEKKSPDVKKNIKKSWKNIQMTNDIKLGDYKKFKEAFEYKSQGSKQFMELKKNKTVSNYIGLDNEEVIYLTFEDPEKLKSIVFFIKGKNSNAFYDFISLDNSIPEETIHQLAIMKFYDLENSNKLIFLNKSEHNEHLSNLGFTMKTIYTIEKEKSSQ